MLADAHHLRQQLVALVGEELAEPVINLETIVKSKPVPKKPNQVGTALNGLLRRGNNANNNNKAEVTVNGQTEAEVEASTVDAAPTTDVPPPVVDPPHPSQEPPIPVEVAASVPLPDD